MLTENIKYTLCSVNFELTCNNQSYGRCVGCYADCVSRICQVESHPAKIHAPIVNSERVKLKGTDEIGLEQTVCGI